MIIVPLHLLDTADRILNTRTIRWSGPRWHLMKYNDEAPFWEAAPIGAGFYQPPFPRTDAYTGEIIYNRHWRKRGYRNGA